MKQPSEPNQDRLDGNGPRTVAGPVIRKDHQLQPTTTDQRLLQPTIHAEWVHEDPWRVMRIQAEFVDGFGTLAELGPAISMFGSARTNPGDPLYEAAEIISRRLVERGYAVITGGGPGVMEAGNKGAREAGGTSVGLGIELPFEESMNRWVNLGINFRYFFARKVMFLKYARGFIVLPGGYGTFDELFEALTLIQTGKIEHFPIALYGTEYWSGLIDWLRTQTLADGYIESHDLDLLMISDDLDEVVDHVISGSREANAADVASDRRGRSPM